jgi:hypothetical protein
MQIFSDCISNMHYHLRAMRDDDLDEFQTNEEYSRADYLIK